MTHPVRSHVVFPFMLGCVSLFLSLLHSEIFWRAIMQGYLHHKPLQSFSHALWKTPLLWPTCSSRPSLHFPASHFHKSLIIFIHANCWFFPNLNKGWAICRTGHKQPLKRQSGVWSSNFKLSPGTNYITQSNKNKKNAWLKIIVLLTVSPVVFT